MTAVETLRSQAKHRAALPAWSAIGAAFVLLICTTAREIASLCNWGDISATSGTWIATSVDAQHGIWYRPLVSETGYGGTRYAPIRTLVQAEILKLNILSPLTSAVFSSGLSISLLLIGCYALMRRLDISRPLAILMTAMLFASNGVRASIFAGMSDPLATALAVWGLVAITARNSGATLWAAAIFALAAATKFTCIFAFATALIWLVSQKHYRKAAQCAVVTAVFILLLFLSFQWLSDGRMLSVFRACATGGAGISGILQAPVIFSGILCRFDPVAGGLWVCALIGIIFDLNRPAQTRRFAWVFLLTATAGTMLIYSSPGTDMNHLLDLNVAAILCLAISLQRDRRWLAIIVVLALFGSAVSVKDAIRIRGDSRVDQISKSLAIAQQQPGDGPLLCENPLLPILAGQPPYMLDCFMFHVFTNANPALSDQLWRDIATQKFRAVILCPVGGPSEWTHPGSFGYEALPHIEASYTLANQFGKYYVFLPKPRS